MKIHITKLVAVLMAVLMMVSLVPAAALSDFNLPALMSVFGGNSAANNTTDNAAADGNGNASDAETAIPTEDGTPVSQAGGENLYIADDGTLYMDTDGDGTAEAIVGDTVSDVDFPFNIQQGKVTNDEIYYAEAINNGQTGLDSAGMVPKSLSAYEPADTNNEDHPFLPGGAAWIDLSEIFYGAPATQNYPLTKWSANTSVYNITEYGSYTEGVAATNGDKKYAFRDVDLIDGYTFAAYANDPLMPGINGSVSSNEINHSAPILTQKNGNTAYAYNRYDAMQGKYGITFDRNVKSAVWSPSWRQNYFPDATQSDGLADLYNSVVYLSDTPYLYFSTEALDSTKIAISLLIGTPVQKEIANPKNDKGQTVTTNTKYYEYRWYTITDNSDRPGIDADSMNNSMVPIVTISDVVATVAGENDANDAYDQQNSTVVPTVVAAGKNDPIALATAKGVEKDSLYVNGSITGCLDFTNLLPVIMGTDLDNDGHDRGREDSQAKVAQIRVDTDTVTGGTNSAFRMNYMYFGPSLSTVFSPQNTVGQNEDAQSWQYAQTSSDSIGSSDMSVGASAGSSDDRAYTNGWENGEAVSIINTPNNPQLITVDTYGIGDGQLVEWDTVTNDQALQGSSDSKVWKFTDKNGVVQYMEAEREGSSQTSDEYYVMVTVPVRKWINVLGESRKISLTATLLQNGVNQNGATSKYQPAFVLWGNEDGSIGPGHSGPGFGPRFRNEDLIMVFAHKGDHYHVDVGNTYTAQEVDRTIGDGLFWNAPGATKESWFDVLRSPYTYDETVTATNANNGHGSELIGYTFISALRFAMPIGSAVQIQNMKGDGNSAGLNTYSTSGEIVSAYDGGTGEQPIVDVDSTLPEKNVTVTKTGTGSTAADYTYTQGTQGDGSIKGHITSGAAAYGPMLQESFYTIYDLLDTEMIRESSRDSHHAGQTNKKQQIVYGQAWTNNSTTVRRPIYSSPKTSGSQIYGYVYENREITAYARVNFVNSSNTRVESWVLTGVLTSGYTPELGWVKIWETGNTYFQDGVGMLLNGTLLPGDPRDGQDYPLGNFNDYSYSREVLRLLKNNWALSNFSGIYTSFAKDATSGGFEYGRRGGDDTSPKYNYPEDVYNTKGGGSDRYDGLTLQFANQWAQDVTATNSVENLQDTHFRTVNGTDLEFGFTRQLNTDKNWSIGMTRTFETPIVLKQGRTDIHASYPVLYLDYDNPNSKVSFLVALSVRQWDGTMDAYGNKNYDNYLFHVKSDTELNPFHYGTKSGNQFMYLSFEHWMTQNSSSIERPYEIVALSLYSWSAIGDNIQNNNITIRRCEVWQEETDWLDNIIADNQQAGGDTSTAMNCQVKDSMNLVNDAFFNAHNESTDGGYTLTKTDTIYSHNIGINNKNKAYTFTVTRDIKSEKVAHWVGDNKYEYDRSITYRKSNSNKGWSAYIRTDVNNDGRIDASDDTRYSYGGYENEGVYQYVSSLGHLRVWVPEETEASVVFESDRSFNTNNYKYLYYSYSMRDTDTGIAAEEPDTARTDGKKPGIAVAIKQNQLGSSTAYSEIVTSDGERTWAFYDKDNPYWSEDGRDNRTFKTTINAAADLSSFDGIDSVNQFVFYLKNPMNNNDGKVDKAEFYINYIYLSNVPPTNLIKEKLEEQQVQYYYLMDNTGDRYSARFPTIDNPTGAITGLNCDNDRNNPVIVNRGARLSDGKFFNGDLLYGYGTGDRKFDQTTGSEGYYEKDYGSADGIAGSFKNIWFYAGDDGDPDTYTDIKDMYMYKDRPTDKWDDGVGNIYDMLWSYGRWYLGEGESGLNNMYIGNPKNLGANDTADGVSGNLVRRYATENYVLLRSGIQPRKYQTYYDSDGGQFVYDSSNETIKDGIQLDENSYYITETVLFSQFTHPLFHSELSIPVKYGYIFDGWFTTDDIDVNQTGDEDEMFKYHRKQQPDLNYFYAKWSEDPAYENVQNVAQFYDINGDEWFSQTASRDENEFKLTMPDVTQVESSDGAIVPIRGWKVKDDTSGTIYVPGQDIILQKSVELVPVTSTTSETGLSLTITLHDAELYLITEVDDNGKYTGSLADIAKNHVKLNDYMNKGYHGITITQSGNVYTYTNVPRDIILVAVPLNTKSNGVWSIANTTSDEVALETDQTNPINGSDYLNGTTMTLVSVNNAEYQFSAYEDMEFTYSALALDQQANYKDDKGAVSTMLSSTSTWQKPGVREMVFVSSFDLSNVANATPVAWGTLYTKNMMYNRFGDDAKQDEAMRLDESTDSINAESIKKGSFMTANTNVRQVMATAKSKSNQYYLRVTEVDGKKVWYFARSYVIYQVAGDNNYYVAYSSVVRKEVLNAVETSTEL